jgi:tetratricopeptide (TPR) repeat protein
MPKGVIERAVQLYRQRRFPQLIRLLESQVFRFRENAEFYRLLGSACLYSGDFGGAESYLRRADQLHPDSPPILIGLAAVQLKRGETDKALSLWLRILDVDPGNRTAMAGLNLLRQAASAERAPDLQDSRSLRQLMPPTPVRPWRVVLPLLLVALAGGLVAGYFLLLPRLPRPASPRPGVAEIELSDTRPALSTQQDHPMFELSESEIEDGFAKAKRHLLAYRDNLAIREINRILLSNASAYVKEKARLLKSFVRTPDFTTIRDPFEFREVAANPALYRDGFVLWRGKVANVRIGEQAIRFDLLVGYQDQRELEGIVPVLLEFAADLDDGIAVEVLARLSGEDSQIVLDAISIHRLYKLR